MFSAMILYPLETLIPFFGENPRLHGFFPGFRFTGESERELDLSEPDPLLAEAERELERESDLEGERPRRGIICSLTVLK